MKTRANSIVLKQIVLIGAVSGLLLLALYAYLNREKILYRFNPESVQTVLANVEGTVSEIQNRKLIVEVSRNDKTLKYVVNVPEDAVILRSVTLPPEERGASESGYVTSGTYLSNEEPADFSQIKTGEKVLAAGVSLPSHQNELEAQQIYLGGSTILYFDRDQ